jgi:hypothetical protein
MKIIVSLDHARRAGAALLLSAALISMYAPIPVARAQANGEPIKIGDMFSTTGSLAGLGSEALAGADPG